MAGWGNPVRLNWWPPDLWFGERGKAIVDITGARAQALIPRVDAAIRSYQYSNYGDYRIWPGPNSNTFVATVLRAIPETEATLPPNAIGRDFRPWPYLGLTDSGTGVEANLWGLLGVKIGWVEGLEINVLGLVAGLDLRNPGVKLPALRPRRLAAGYGDGAPGASDSPHNDLHAGEVTPHRPLPDWRHARCLPRLEQIPFPAIRRGRLDTLQINVGYRCNQSCVHCHVGASPHRTEEMSGETADTVLAVSRPAAHRCARHHRRRAGAEPAFPAHRHGRPRHGRACDGPLQPHHHGGRRPGGSAGVSRPRAGRGRGLDAVLPRGQRGPPARQGRVRRLDPRIAAAQRAGLRPRRLGARAQPRLQSAGAVAAAAAGGAGGRLQARARRATTASCSTGSIRWPTCRSSASARR